jgi:hypothetical protein
MWIKASNVNLRKDVLTTYYYYYYSSLDVKLFIDACVLCCIHIIVIFFIH